MNKNDIADIRERLARIEEKIDLVLPQVAKNTAFRIKATAVLSFLAFIVTALSGYVVFFIK